MEARLRRIAGTPAGVAHPGYERFRDWILRSALPFWADRGVDPAGAGFEEHLTVAGERDTVAFKRIRVQARQIYVYSHAARLGWAPGLEIARRGYDFLMASGRRADGGWPSRLDRRGAVIDDTAELYDIAFVLFALAWYARASGSAAPIAEAHRTLDWLDAHMANPHGGYHNSLPRRDEPREQNPHMHLLEAALALYETSGEARFLDLARDLVGLFRDHIFDPATGALGEFFADDWRIASGADGARLEPGHHYEWVWLLSRFEAAAGEDLSGERRALFNLAQSLGLDPRTGLVLDAIGRDGEVLKDSFRLWPQAEAIKAQMVMPDERPAEAAERRLEVLFGRFLARSPAGAWHDHLDAEGRPRSTTMPASSFYHLFMAFAEMAAALDPYPDQPLADRGA